MKHCICVVFLFFLFGCSSTSVTYLENGATSDDCSSSVEISSTEITMTNECGDDEAVKKIKLE